MFGDWTGVRHGVVSILADRGRGIAPRFSASSSRSRLKSARLQGEPPTDSGLHSDMGELSIAHTRSGRPHNPILASATLSEANHCLEALAAAKKRL